MRRRLAATAQALTEVERAILKIAASEERVARVRYRIARLREGGRSTEIHDAFLTTLQDSLLLMKAHLGRLTSPVFFYRCYLMVNETIRGVQMFDCHDDAEAIIEASYLLE